MVIDKPQVLVTIEEEVSHSGKAQVRRGHEVGLMLVDKLSVVSIFPKRLALCLAVSKPVIAFVVESSAENKGIVW